MEEPKKPEYDKNLWNNPMVQSAREAMTPEQIEEYKRIGEEMYSVDFPTSTVPQNSNADFLKEPTKYICKAIESGLHPSYLSDNEKEILRQSLGEKWYEQYGYSEEDLEKIT